MTTECIRQAFFGCNYNDKSIKDQFDALKTALEEGFPVDCIVIDKRASKPAKSIWRTIQEEILKSDVCFFDVTAFRPNVVLELGFALAHKTDDQVFVTWRRRKAKGVAPKWLLTDISHLNRFEYSSATHLQDYVEEQLVLRPWLRRVTEFQFQCETTSAAASQKYQDAGHLVCTALRDHGPQTEAQLTRLTRGTGIRFATLIQLLRRAKLVRRTAGQPGKFALADA